jgi:hypothetical protein
MLLATYNFGHAEQFRSDLQAIAFCGEQVDLKNNLLSFVGEVNDPA